MRVLPFQCQGLSRTEAEFHLGEERIQTVPVYRYLGVFLDKFLTMKEHIDAVTEAGTHALQAIWSLQEKIGDIGWRTFDNSGTRRLANPVVWS